MKITSEIKLELNRYIDNGNKKLYYGHVNGLGYFIAEAELVGTITTASDEEIREVW